MKKALAILFLACAALPAAAAGPSPRWGAAEVSFGGYRPNVDREFGGNGPFAATFGGKRNLFFRADLAKALLTGYGELDVGIGLGYWEKYGVGHSATGLGSDSTALKIIPTRLSLTYRFDQVAERFRWLPIAPYVRASFDRYNWWVNNGSGSTANSNGKSGSGATNGYSFSGGIAVLLDSIDPDLAREADRDTGINHTYLFIDFTKSYIRDFGSSQSWDLSDDRKVNISGGILFVF